MRNPGRLRNLALAAGISGMLSAGVPFVVADRAEQGAWLLIGGMAAAIGLGTALTLTLRVRRMRRLNAGKGVLARWRIDPAIWAHFVADDRDAERDGRRLNNALRLRAKPGRGVDVIVGDDCVQVDGDFHRVLLAELTGARVTAGPPSILELRFVTPGAQQPDTHWALRFPVGLGAEVVARRAVDQYTNRYRAKYGTRW